MNLQQLNDKFAFNRDGNQLSIKVGAGGIPCIEVNNKYASAIISLQGAQVLSWIPSGQEDVIWLSEEASFAPGKSVRGGIPICWPWFGPHQSNPDFPAHGFARTSMWHIVCSEALDNGACRITFSTSPQNENANMWPPQTSVQYQINIGEKLEMELITHNNGTGAITIGQALHTYFKVADVDDVLLHGLDDTHYLDKLDNFERKLQHGPVSINQEIDRIYLNTATECVIEDKSLQRNIIIIKCGSHSTVVWNPWQETAAKMGDLGEQGYKKMLCVESANAAEDTVTIEAGGEHHLWIQYQVQSAADNQA